LPGFLRRINFAAMTPKKTILIPLPPVFSFKECLWFLNRNFDDCMHSIAGDGILKALDISGEKILIRLSQQQESLEITLLEGRLSKAIEQYLSAYVQDWLDMDKDLTPFYSLLQREKKLSAIASDYAGLRLVGIPDLFEALCWSIIGQQINLSFAYKLKRRLTERYGTKIVHKGESYYIFPVPAALAVAEVQELREMQFSQKKAEYLVNLAGAFDKGELSKSRLLEMPSFTERQQALTAFRGIGIWTANYALMKSLRMSEAIPYGDVGLLQALVNKEVIKDRKDEAGIGKLFRKFKGWESYLVFYLWRSLSEPGN
jgi:DNA-3-methyladenine glycosylase II